MLCLVCVIWGVSWFGGFLGFFFLGCGFGCYCYIVVFLVVSFRFCIGSLLFWVLVGVLLVWVLLWYYSGIILVVLLGCFCVVCCYFCAVRWVLCGYYLVFLVLLDSGVVVTIGLWVLGFLFRLGLFVVWYYLCLGVGYLVFSCWFFVNSLLILH